MNLFDFFSFSSPVHNKKLQADAALCTKNERTKNGADAKPCLSDVYKNGTRAKRRQTDVPLCGRSMVEMLGVLAIIGVLSVGAISGYSKAMMKYKLNKQTEQFTQLYYAVLQIDITNENMLPYLEKLNLIPREMISNNNYIYDVFNLQVVLSADNEHKNIVITMSNVKDQNNTLCLNILNSTIPWAAELSHVGVDSKQSASDEQHTQDWFFGDNETYCYSNQRCIRTLTLAQMQNLCQICYEDYCNLYIAFNK